MMTAQKFNALMRQIAQGQMSALEPIYNEFYRSVRAEAMWIVSDSDADDVASEVMLKLVRYAQSEDRKEVKDAGAFVYVMAKRTALDFLRRRLPSVAGEYIDQVPDPRGAEDSALDGITVQAAVQRLPELERNIAIMFYFYDSKIKAIAEELGISEGAVKWHLHEIRGKLYKYIK